jgi:hypothetical protein
MPTTVSGLLGAARLQLAESVGWGGPIPLPEPGVYLVSRCARPDDLVAPGAADISSAAVAELLSVRPELTLDGCPTSVHDLAARLSGFWLSDEPVVYIGLASTSVRSRVNAYYRTPLGARQPHAGGWFLKVLADLSSFSVHVAAADDPKAAESALLEAFCAGVSADTRANLHDPAHPFPFANLEWPAGTRKLHGITGAKEPRRASK